MKSKMKRKIEKKVAFEEPLLLCSNSVACCDVWLRKHLQEGAQKLRPLPFGPLVQTQGRGPILSAQAVKIAVLQNGSKRNLFRHPLRLYHYLDGALWFAIVRPAREN